MPITITFSQAGSFTIEDDGIAGNNTSIVRRDSDGAILAVIPHPADSLVFRATVPGVNLSIDFTDSLGSASLLVGNLTDPNLTPDSIVVRNVRTSSAVTLVSNGSIVEGGSDFAADIVANSIILSAQTGVGTAGNAIETQTGLLEAETNTGGINLANVGNLQVGGFSADVDGLDVVTSGDIFLTSLGSITLADETSFDSVHGGDSSGNVTLVANGFDSDITSSVDQSSIIAPRGSIFLTAGRDISFGLAGTEFGNDVRANNDIVVNAGRDFLLSGFADFFANGVLGTTGGNLVVNAGRNVSLLDDTGTSASLATLGTSGDVVITTGANGTFTLEPPSTNAISSGGDVVVNADRMLIFASAGITTPGTVTLRPVTAGRDIVLGSLSDAGAALELSDGELDRVFANSLVVGSSSAGPITVGAPIAPASVANWTLQSGTDIFVNSSLTAATTLSLLAGDNVFQLAASTIAATTVVVSGDVGDTDPGFGARVLMNGAIGGSNTLNGDNDADTINGTGQANLINGFGGADTLQGFGGADTIDGGTGADTMLGGFDGDFYFVDHAGDVVTELAGQGNDRIFATVSYVLAAGTSVEILSTASNSGTAAIDLTGNELANALIGNAGVNVLDGGGGIDDMSGLGGSDWYFVDNAGDIVAENADPLIGGASDRVFARVSYTLGAGRGIEILSTASNSGTDAIDLTGNEFANALIGNAGANILDGGGGIDNMAGLGGNDWYFVDHAADIVAENASAAVGGTADRVFATTSYALAAGTGIEILSTASNSGTGAIDLTGNAFAQSILGNNGANVLNGKAGKDAINGLGGADIFVFDTALNTAPGSAWAALASTANVDNLSDFNVAADTIHLDNAVFVGLGLGTLSAGAFNTGAAASQADDRIIYDPATGALIFDPDGSAGSATVFQFAVVAPGLALSNADFVVI